MLSVFLFASVFSFLCVFFSDGSHSSAPLPTILCKGNSGSDRITETKSEPLTVVEMTQRTRDEVDTPQTTVNTPQNVRYEFDPEQWEWVEPADTVTSITVALFEATLREIRERNTLICGEGMYSWIV